ncbi:MAG: hypothetical protein ABI461_19495 [Polyangiaceae bacterium]
MITKIAPNAPSTAAELKIDSVPAKTNPAEKKGDPNIAKVASQFEQVFVRQLLSAAKVGGSQESGGYGAMAVDALATGISQGGGLGIAAQIAAALDHSNLGATHAIPKTESAVASPAVSAAKSGK